MLHSTTLNSTRNCALSVQLQIRVKCICTNLRNVYLYHSLRAKTILDSLAHFHHLSPESSRYHTHTVFFPLSFPTFPLADNISRKLNENTWWCLKGLACAHRVSADCRNSLELQLEFELKLQLAVLVFCWFSFLHFFFSTSVLLTIFSNFLQPKQILYYCIVQQAAEKIAGNS